jgi:site-specific DNA-cytosine methylase
MLTDIKHFHIFCGAGGGALGFQRGQAKVGPLQARFVCLGGIDNDASACRDFARLVGTLATCLDLFSAEQYAAFHGRRPGPSWREASADDLRRAAQGQRPDILFFSAPCKGFSGLLSSERSASPKYEALNGLALRGLMLSLEAWGDDPPALILFENVPRIAQRGRRLLDQIMGLLRAHGYAARETTHDAGELGGLAQHRRRFLLVARHEAKVPSFLYEPTRRRVRSIGEELAALPPPGAAAAGPMHALPQLTWPTWVRLALIPAGKDWRALKGLDLSKFGLLRYGDHAGKMRVEPWAGPSHTVTGSDRVGSGALSVADVRWGEYRQYGVLPLDRPSGAVTAQAAPGSGSFSVADPSWRKGILGVQPLSEPSTTITGMAAATRGAFSIADLLPTSPSAGLFNNVCRLVRWDEPSACVTSGGRPSAGGLSVADPRAEAWANAGHYGVVPWDSSAGTVTAGAAHDNGRNSVADPRNCQIEQFGKAGSSPLIVALDGTWHRPLTTLELAALQGFPVAGLVLDGKSHSSWRERIGNAVPPPAAQAIAGVMGQVLLMARSGQTFALSSTPIWVRQVALALTVDASS